MKLGKPLGHFDGWKTFYNASATFIRGKAEYQIQVHVKLAVLTQVVRSIKNPLKTHLWLEELSSEEG